MVQNKKSLLLFSRDVLNDEEVLHSVRDAHTQYNSEKKSENTIKKCKNVSKKSESRIKNGEKEETSLADLISEHLMVSIEA